MIKLKKDLTPILLNSLNGIFITYLPDDFQIIVDKIDTFLQNQSIIVNNLTTNKGLTNKEFAIEIKQFFESSHEILVLDFKNLNELLTEDKIINFIKFANKKNKRIIILSESEPSQAISNEIAIITTKDLYNRMSINNNLKEINSIFADNYFI